MARKLEYLHVYVEPGLKETYRKLAIKLHERGEIDRPIPSILYRQALKQFLDANK